jgi:nitrate/TMAO reductase-like tetraheme cytochrome c subunit
MIRWAMLGTVGCVVMLALSCRLIPAKRDTLGVNAACYVCHATFVQEELTTVHLKQAIGCIRCHGTSAAHANDEHIGATKPDVIIKGTQINGFCRDCHHTHDVPPERLLARAQERGLSKPPSSVTCTDCHGRHKIAKPSQ